VQSLAEAGVAVIAHMGLRPQMIGLLGRYQIRGRQANEARQIVELAMKMQDSGAAALLLEAVPATVSAAVVEAVSIPVIGCGAGPACHGHVFVTHDALGLTSQAPRFVPVLGDIASPLKESFRKYVHMVESGAYPAPGQTYEMPAAEKQAFMHPSAP
jgi:3-methyl-2-oxobutanoate hydroxymethyltransferase